MAIALHSDRRHIVRRPPLMRIRQEESNAGLALILVMLLTIGITALLLSSQMLDVSVPRSLIASTQPAAPYRPADGAEPVAEASATDLAMSAPAVEPAAVAPPALASEGESAASEPDGLAVGARARVVNTDNLGVVFSAAPRDGARQPAGLLEGTAVTVLDRSGDEWARVQSDSKKAGWVRVQYLAPAE